jgi:AraC-like DNA-binding protein
MDSAPIQKRAYSFRHSARSASLGELRIAGITCRVDNASYEGSAESEICLPSDIFACVVNGQLDERVDATFEEGPRLRRQLSCPTHSLFVPNSQSFTTKRRGRVDTTYFLCEVSPTAYSRLFGGEFKLGVRRPHFGPSPMPADVVRRLAVGCQEQDRVPLAYVETATTILLIDILRCFGESSLEKVTKLTRTPNSRFESVKEFVEASLGQDVSLYDMADLAGLSIARFSHAFKARYGVAPYQYLLMRRIERAKSLLRTTEEPVTSIGAAVGFVNPARFGQAFRRVTGVSPSQYRKTLNA